MGLKNEKAHVGTINKSRNKMSYPSNKSVTIRANLATPLKETSQLNGLWQEANASRMGKIRRKQNDKKMVLMGNKLRSS